MGLTAPSGRNGREESQSGRPLKWASMTEKIHIKFTVIFILLVTNHWYLYTNINYITKQKKIFVYSENGLQRNWIRYVLQAGEIARAGKIFPRSYQARKIAEVLGIFRLK